MKTNDLVKCSKKGNGIIKVIRNNEMWVTFDKDVSREQYFKDVDGIYKDKLGNPLYISES